MDSRRGTRALPRPRWPWWLGFAILALISVLLPAAYVATLIPRTPSIDDLRRVRMPVPSVVLAMDGQVLTTFRRARQEQVALQQVSPFVIKALLATEDRRFYEHPGVDFQRSLAAVFHTLNGRPQGGSTITQQLVRNLFPEEIGRARTSERKLKEMITALRIERLYSKAQILETYLNTIPFPYNVVGIEMAARTYFDKSAADLDALESATLIAMLKGPHYYNPGAHPARVQKRRNLVLRQMVLRQDLTEADYRTLHARPLRVSLNQPAEPPGAAPHFAVHVRKWLIEWAARNNYDLEADGLVVHTTLDSALQQLASQAVLRQAAALQDIADVEWGRAAGGTLSRTPEAYASMKQRSEPFAHFWKTRTDLADGFVRETPEYKAQVLRGVADATALATLHARADFMRALKAGKTRLEAGFVAIDPASGEVRAWVGSRDFRRDQYDHVVQAERQPGSTFKPMVYGAALERGKRPDSVYYDNPVQVTLADGTLWQPTDQAGASGEAMTLRQGLAQSKNTITAQVMQEVGVPAVVRLAQALGVNRSKLDPVPSLALGTSSVTLLEMVSAYASIAGLGEYRQPLLVTRITDRGGRVVARFGVPARRGMSAASAITLVDMMRDVISQGTGQAIKARFGIAADVAGKTGTTQKNTDGWFILMHPGLVAGAWVGFNDARVTMRSDYWGQGGHNAVLLVGDFFRDAFKSGRIDARAEFPRRARPPVVAAAPDDGSGRVAGEDGGDRGPDNGELLVQNRPADPAWANSNWRGSTLKNGPVADMPESSTP
jgi:penicillin-binding protein 1A